MINAATTETLSPDKQAISAHLDFLFKDLTEYSDCFIQIAWTPAHNGQLTQAKNFLQTDIEAAASWATEINKTPGQNVYVIASLLDPDMAPFGRASDDDAYIAPCGWVDIDDGYTPEELKKIYEELRPSAVVVTGRRPAIRTQMWFKYFEPQTDHDTIRETNEGLIAAFKGDRACPNPARPMRLAGSVAWPKKAGRLPELTELKFISGAKPSTPELLMNKYPIGAYTPQHRAPPTDNILNIGIEKITDGRDRYMSDMIYVAIINLSKKLNRLPTHDEVYNDCWPVYFRKVGTKNGQTLEAAKRGPREMSQKIKSKLRGFESGRLCGVDRGGTESKHQEKQAFDPDTGEVKQERQKSSVEYVMAKDIHASLESKDFVKGLLSENQLSVIYGESNCGKTFFMTDLCFHIGLGRTWRERRVDRGGIVYAALEGSYGLRNRVQAFRQTHGVDDALFAMVASQIDFLNPAGNIDQFIDCIKRAADEMGSCKMVVVDTLARALSGGDENSGQDMGMLVHHADRIRYETGAHVSFVHHSGKNKALGARGHSSLRAAVDTEIEISRDEGADYSTIKIAKQREMEAGEDMYFGLDRIVIGINDFTEEITSCIVKPMHKDELISKKTGTQYLTGANKFIYDSIINALAISNSPPCHPYADGPLLKCISYKQLTNQLEMSGYKEFVRKENETEMDVATRVKNSTTTSRVALHKAGLIGFNKDLIWLL